MSLIEFRNVDFSYLTTDDDGNENKVQVLKNFNLKIEQGTFVAILGHNGSGKSTVAKLTNGILFADSGSVIVDGIETKDDDTIFKVRRRVGMVFQNPDNQIVSSIVEEDVAFGVENLGIEPASVWTMLSKRLICMSTGSNLLQSFQAVKNNVWRLQVSSL